MSVYTLCVIYDDFLMKEERKKFIWDGKLAVREKAIKISVNGHDLKELKNDAILKIFNVYLWKNCI